MDLKFQFNFYYRYTGQILVIGGIQPAKLVGDQCLYLITVQ